MKESWNQKMQENKAVLELKNTEEKSVSEYVNQTLFDFTPHVTVPYWKRGDNVDVYISNHHILLL